MTAERHQPTTQQRQALLRAGAANIAVTLICAALSSAASAAEAAAGDSAPTPEQIQFFEVKVRPLLAERCLKCHGPRKQWGGLRLDSREALLRGGESGPAMVPGKPDESLLIRAVRQEDDAPQMPQDDKLDAQQIETLARWVAIGAPFPASTARPADKPLRDPNHWAFQPLGEPLAPRVSGAIWPQTAVDHFILAKLEAAGLSPAERADKRTLIRRVTFDLIGLPPTPREIEAFVADGSPLAFSRVVDRLLASPRYGERWGRHWLDVARYADSNGFDENVAQGNAWRYRDYVVAAFNGDKPFDEFVVEQLAGDLLPFDHEAQRHERLIATGFLSIGPKVLAETDQSKMRMDIIDEQLDTMGRAFLGLTLGCARCHDHKFDPIDTADYYGLAGIFQSTRTMRKYVKVAEWHEHLLPSAAATAIQTAFDASVAAQKAAIAELTMEADAAVREKLAAQPDAKPPESLAALYPEATKASLAKLRAALDALEKEGPDLPSAMGVTEDQVTDVAIHVRGDPLKLGAVVPRRTPPVIRGPPAPHFTDGESGRRQLAEWLVDSRNPLTARVFVNRVWRLHFGSGIVRSTDNFGMLGDAPTHPELLDWLALRFIADGWSIKSLHRLILNSSVYQQASDPAAETAQRDPENQLFSRAPVRRLEAEAARDAVLAASGRLDTTMGGSLLKLKNRAYFFDHTSKDLTTYHSSRRSLYLPIVRNNVFDVLQLLDFPDPAVATGDRATTIVASQALLMLNSDFVMEAADAFADRLLADFPADDQRLAQLYAVAFGRPPTAEEQRADRAFLARAAEAQPAGGDEGRRQRQAWSALCHVAIAANEFLYLK